MKQFRLLAYEDDPDWKEGFEFNVKPKLSSKGVNITIVQKLDDSTLMQDLEWLPNLILVDFDLGDRTGVEIIEQINGDPQYVNTSVFFYSGGESIEKLKSIAEGFVC